MPGERIFQGDGQNRKMHVPKIDGHDNSIHVPKGIDPASQSLVDAILAKEGLPPTHDTTPITPDNTPLAVRRTGKARRH